MPGIDLDIDVLPFRPLILSTSATITYCFSGNVKEVVRLFLSTGKQEQRINRTSFFIHHNCLVSIDIT
ncbi:hypothetical protein D3C71_1349730 [compost metagenome]